MSDQIVEKFSSEVISQEVSDAEKVAAAYDAFIYSIDGCTILLWHKVPGGWERYHPKAIHNSKIMISDMLNIDIENIISSIAAEWIRGLITQDELISRLHVKV